MAERTTIGERDFTPDAASVAQARRYVLSLLELDPTTTESVQLAVSELATNAVLHARSPFRVRVSIDSTTARVAVFDHSEATAARKDYGPEAVTGRGLTIVERVTDDWGVTPDGKGKWVWFEVSLTGQAVR
ncbi:MAG TPA: ATP-binding protein [Microthrixaceae bacterium]|jgi:anti-sigma regulatory factor (Ser/Thr protein kinase)|nr:ATP-binding protein [Microthrixaceae bacterium]